MKPDRKKILVVDDEPQLLDQFKTWLERSSFEVITAADGEQALAKARKERPDLILLDIMLPKMDGYKVCGLLKNDERYSRIPIILVSARNQKEDAEQGTSIGADSYLVKPVGLESLLETVRGFVPD